MNVTLYVTDTHLADRDLRAARQLFLALYARKTFHPSPSLRNVSTPSIS
jgi:hypothetical protein